MVFTGRVFQLGRAMRSSVVSKVCGSSPAPGIDCTNPCPGGISTAVSVGSGTKCIGKPTGRRQTGPGSVTEQCGQRQHRFWLGGGGEVAFRGDTFLVEVDDIGDRGPGIQQRHRGIGQRSGAQGVFGCAAVYQVMNQIGQHLRAAGMPVGRMEREAFGVQSSQSSSTNQRELGLTVFR